MARNLKTTLKEKFEYDVTELPNWADNTMPNLIPDLIQNSEFLNDFVLEEGVKGVKEIALLNADVALQAKEGCSLSPDGSVVFTKEDLKTKLLGMAIEFCNEDLNGKMTQVLNVLGLKRQNGQLPAGLDEILMAYLGKLLQKKAQRLVVLGDTTSSDAELALMDGMLKIIENSNAVNSVNVPYATIDATNAYDIATALYGAVPAEVFDNGMEVKIYTGRTEAMAILAQWNQANPYNQVDNPNATGTFEFTLPLFGITIVSVPELTGKNVMWALPMSLWFLGTDLEEDFSFDIKYDDYNDKLKAEASFRLGIAGVWKQYSTKVVLGGTPS